MKTMGFLFLLLFHCPLFAYESPQALQEAFVNAMRSNNVDGLAACYTENATNFTPDTMMGIGPDSARASWGGFFEQFTVASVELSEDHMVVSGDLAAAWGLFTIVAEPKAGGETVVMQGRYMDIAQDRDGKWLYIADHASFPIPPGE
jgi:ketosteroid isomerase-like protein